MDATCNIEATGHPDAVVQGLKDDSEIGPVRRVQRGSRTMSPSIGALSRTANNWTCWGVHLGPYQYPFVISAIADGRIPTEGVVTHQLPLEQYEEGLEMMKKGDKSLKILLVP